MGLKVSRRGQVPAFFAMEVLREANERQETGAEVLHLEVGQPGSGAPQAVLDAAVEALRSQRLGYTDALGLPALRRRVVEHYRASYGVRLDLAQVVMTTGSSGAFLLAFLAAFDPGDRVALASPGYPAYRNILSALGLETLEIPVDAATRFQPTPELIARLPAKPDGLIVASPSNPCGTMLDRDALKRLVDYCRDEGIRMISDEIYHGIVYGAPAHSALEFGNQPIVVNSFSKYYAMTGWRLGWMILPPDLQRAVESLAQNLFISPPALPQHAALRAFDCRAELDGNVRRYAENRARLLAELPEAGFGRFAPVDGAFYLYADIGELTNDSVAFCRRMLQEADVAATPGIDFDPARGHRFLRFSFAGSTADIVKAIERLKRWRRR